ncbi:MAG: hypothetical protein Q7T11_01135 [Deltaproteobacteria bacterium]|nr:hypothetical protein [Deltaproteobacteria bacterium]
MKVKNLISIGTILFLATCGGGSSDSDDEESDSDPTVATISSGTLASATLSTSSVGSDGGTITSTSLTGFAIEVPVGAVGEDITFTVSYAAVTDESGLPEGATTASQIIRITTSGSSEWNDYRTFDLPVKVTLPYTPPAEGEESVRFYVYNEDGTLEPTGFESIDATNNTITFYTRTFANTSPDSVLSTLRKGPGKSVVRNQAAAANATYANYVAAGLDNLMVAWFLDGVSLDSGFRAKTDGFYIPNFGSYYKTSKGGNCLGMSSFAKYYFRKVGSGLRSKYHDDDNTSTWVDDAVGIELASRAHEAESNIWNQFYSGEVTSQTVSSRSVALSYLGGLYVSNQPVLLYITQVIVDAAGVYHYSGEHAIMVYKADIASSGTITFHVYDPNYPNDDTRRITYVDGTGFNTYAGGPSAANPGYSYNYFNHIGYNVAVSDAIYDKLKASADIDFVDGTVFPTITITTITGKTNLEDVTANDETTDNGEHKWVTSDSAVTITGTVLGGLAQTAGNVVDNVNIFVGSEKFTAAVNNSAGSGTGEFSKEVPLKQGENEVVILASTANEFNQWAAFYRNIIESTASPAAFTVTMNWGQDDSDVDLYVQEPSFTSSGASKTGDTVYFGHRDGSSTSNPYLDFDNTTGFGPEHYYAVTGLSTIATDLTSNPDNLYGTYNLRVHYYADHDDDSDTTQPITWNISYRYLAFCEDPCTNPEQDGFWEEGTFSGGLSTADSGQCCSIGNSGSSWSSTYEVEYPEPDPDDYTVPASHEVMLP